MEAARVAVAVAVVVVGAKDADQGARRIGGVGRGRGASSNGFIGLQDNHRTNHNIYCIAPYLYCTIC